MTVAFIPQSSGMRLFYYSRHLCRCCSVYCGGVCFTLQGGPEACVELITIVGARLLCSLYNPCGDCFVHWAVWSCRWCRFPGSCILGGRHCFFHLCSFPRFVLTILGAFVSGPRAAQWLMWSQCCSSWRSLMFSWRSSSTRGRYDWMFTCSSASCTSARWRYFMSLIHCYLVGETLYMSLYVL